MRHLDFTPTIQQKELSLQENPYLDYAYDISEGKIASCKMSYGACKRAIYEHIHPEIYNYRWVFDLDYVDSFIDFCSYVPHVYGDYARRGEKFVLVPFQKFISSQLFGWRSANDDFIKRFTTLILELAKKSGKSSFASLVALYQLKYGDHGEHIVSVATKSEQSRKVWDDALRMVKAADPVISNGIEARHNSIFYGNNSFIFIGNKEKTTDGPNISTLIADESAAIEDRNLIEKLELSMGARSSPLVIHCTHPQYSQETYYFQLRESLRSLLEGNIPLDSQERLLGISYNLDREEDLYDESKWVAASPNIGVSISLDYLRQKVKDAELRPAQKNALLTFFFSMWLKSADRWLSPDLWDKCEKEVRRDKKCNMGIDLSANADLTSANRTWNYGNEYHTDWHFWTTQEYYDSLSPEIQTMFDNAVTDEILTIQHGNVIDYDAVFDYIEETNEEYGINQIGCDPWRAKTLNAKLIEKGYPVLTVPQSMANLGDAIDTIEGKIKNGYLIHDRNPFLRWQFSNCCEITTDKGVKLIKKPKGNRDAKIDGFSALFTAARTIVEREEKEKKFRMTVIKFGQKKKQEENGETEE